MRSLAFIDKGHLHKGQLLPWALAALAFLTPSGAAWATGELSIHASVDGSAPHSGWVYARVGQKVELRAVLEHAETLSHFRWFKIEPTVESVDNTLPSFHFAPIRYQATELTACRNAAVCMADVTPTVLPKVALAPGAGTMGFQLTAQRADGQKLASPGVESVKYGGLTTDVMRVTFRQDDTYLGYLTELINTPYIFGSAGPDGKNQSDLLIGSDCADLAVYGQRRLGKKATYTSSYAIDQQAPLVVTATRLTPEGAVDSKSQPIRWGASKNELRAGDLVHFPNSRHVGVLWADRPPLGVLDANDLIIHTCWAAPRIEPLGDTRCASFPWRVLRFLSTAPHK
ncbi:MAG: hypothetical protein K1X64_01745 [Myxococcaceae bacterium]|nr:hypothetical protein [Myxococcaceae bacterium]